MRNLNLAWSIRTRFFKDQRNSLQWFYLMFNQYPFAIAGNVCRRHNRTRLEEIGMKILSDDIWGIQIFPSLVRDCLRRSVGVQHERYRYSAGGFQGKIWYMRQPTCVKTKTGVPFVPELDLSLQIEFETNWGSFRIYWQLSWNCNTEVCGWSSNTGSTTKAYEVIIRVEMERVFNHFDRRAEFFLKDGQVTDRILASESKSDGYWEMGRLTSWDILGTRKLVESMGTT